MGCYLLCHKDHPLDPLGFNGGAEMATIYLAQALVRAGHRVVVAAELKQPEGLYEGVQYWDLGPDYDTQTALDRMNEYGSYFLISAGRAQILVQSKNNSACVARILITHDRAGNDTGLNVAIVSRIADCLVCVSTAQRDVIIKHGADPAKTKVINNGVDLDLYAAGDPALRNPRRLVFAGALVEDKGIHYLIQSFAELRAKYSDLTLDVYGSAALWGRKEFLDWQQIETHVPGIKFHGNVQPQVLAQAYREAGLCAYPSIWFEPFGLCAADALATGCPVVAFDVGGPRDIVIDGETGLLLKDISVPALTKALDSLIAEPARLRALSQNILSKFRARFSWEKVARQIEQTCAAACTARAESLRIERGPVAVLTTWNQECGLATYARYMLSAWEPGSYVVLGEKADLIPGCRDEPFVRRCWQRGSKDFSELRAALRDSGIRLLHLNCHYRFFPQPEFAQCLRELRQAGIKVVIQLHNPYTRDPVLQSLVSEADLILVHTSENRLEVVANDAPAEKVEVLPHGVVLAPSIAGDERTRLRQRFGVPEGARFIVSFGFVQAHKGMEGLLEGVAHLKGRGVAAYGLIAGSHMAADPHSREYVEQLRAYAQRLGVAGQVSIPDRFFTEEEVRQCLQAADVVLMNYQSQYYEASGACSLAVGAGAVVAASIAPPFAAFGDAVWHITSGYPAALSLEILLTNKGVRETLLQNVKQYSSDNSWEQISKKLARFYRQIGFERVVMKQEKAVNSENMAMGRSALKVLMQNRSTAHSHPGGDTVLMEETAQGLRALGVAVDIDLNGAMDPRSYDLVHLFNFATPDATRAMAQRAQAAGVPYVVSTLCEDISAFHNQSISVAQALMEYVKRNQDRTWWEENPVDWRNVPGCQAFDNAWTAEHSAALLCNGRAEAEVLRRCYPGARSIIEVKLGFDAGGSAPADLFEREYGVRDFVLCVGRIETRKNQLMLLKALEDWEGPVVLAAGGFSYQPEYDRAVRSLRRKGNTLILGRLTPEMLASAYAACRVHALPSWYELPGLVSLEAACRNKNVVVTAYGTARDYLGKKPFICEPGDENSVYNAVMAAYYAPPVPGLRETASQYSWKATAQNTLAAYHQCVQGVTEAKARVIAPDWSRAAVWQMPGQTAASSPGNSPLKAPSAEVYQPVSESELLAALDKSEEAALRGDFGAAHGSLAALEQRAPNNSRILRAQGALYVAEGRVQMAYPYLERALAGDPQDAKAWCALGMCKCQEGKAAEGYQLFLRSLELSPDNMTAIHELLRCAYELRRYDDLERVLRGYHQRHPEDREMQYCLAGCLFRAGRKEESKQLAMKVLQVDPAHKGARELLELLHKPQATAGITTAASARVIPEKLETNPQVPPKLIDDVDQRFGVIEDQKRDRKWSEVKQACSEILARSSLRPDQRERAMLMTAEALVLEGNAEEAAPVFAQVLEANPRSARAICGLGALAGHRNAWDEAWQLFQRALEYKPEYDVALAGLAMVMMQRGEGERAWEYFNRAVRANPENLRALLGLIETGYPLRKFAEVETALKNYLDLHPADLDFLYSLAGCYYAQNKLKLARGELEKLMLFSPHDARARELESMITARENRES